MGAGPFRFYSSGRRGKPIDYVGMSRVQMVAQSVIVGVLMGWLAVSLAVGGSVGGGIGVLVAYSLVMLVQWAKWAEANRGR